MSRQERQNSNTFLLTYRDLINIWQDWSDTSPVQPLDRWLRQYSRSQRQQSPAFRMAINNAMMEALRYRQLADALELTFRDPTYDDWKTWDSRWQADTPLSSSPSHFWYWIQLCSNSDWRLPHSLEEQKARREHFNAFKAQADSLEENATFLLAHGLRPTWEALLFKRAEKSGWDDKQLARLVRMQTSRPPLWLRLANMADAAALQQALSEEGVQVGEYQGHLYATGGKDITLTNGWKNGQFEVQDLASQQICDAVDVKPGHKVWDACAGAGGKSLTLARALAGKGAVVATDLHAYKLEELKRRAKRAGISNIRSFTWDADAPLRLPAEIARQQGFDRILVDAPCSNSGTWRRNPDARWRLDNHNTRELAALQGRILAQASKALRPGGRLVYATCSWQVAENEDVVAAFLAANPEFCLVEQKMLGAPVSDSDSMFVAVLSRP
ncbi:RsmB/NOP family class I SAM-dependent RNA methyltransferase [Parathalassolituus penaei]|uniref:RsmB/NOP family class I SAM-dependent RNA methyltransferase n=1 Tax=Parathalassolituus penaei TaxID=2997323 RepID=A0A9X3EE99_9GAMM|nr:RsmB/NOP family class I SAM-dependent RNA methyltransferase [Parathalassolituus penaei]MCY0965967.1 RsmB/NOP family class I SAM-dependent RNA methyltransferase [Parathalassolituus penaei]